MIILDNIIFELQKIGGVSRFWYGLINQFLKSQIEIKYLDGNNSYKNLYRNNLNLNNIFYLR